MSNPAYEDLIDLDALSRFKTRQDAYNAETYLGLHDTADEALKLPDDVDAGSGNQPVHFVDGLPVAISYTLNKTVPADAKFTDTTYDDVVADPSGASASGLMSSADKHKLDGIESGSEANVIETVKVNGTALAVSNKAVDVLIATGGAGTGTISVNGSDVAVHGLGTAAAADVSASGVAEGSPGLVTGGQVYDAVSAALTSALVYKGVKATVAELPASGNRVGDMWHVTETGGEYAWDGSAWEEMGGIVDLSAYVRFSDITIVSESAIDAMFASA